MDDSCCWTDRSYCSYPAVQHILWSINGFYYYLCADANLLGNCWGSQACCSQDCCKGKHCGLHLVGPVVMDGEMMRNANVV